MLTHFKNSKKIRPRQRIFFYLFLGILYLAIIGFLFISNLKIHQKRVKLETQANQLKKEIQFLEEKNQQLKAGILEQETEGYLEKEARERLGLKKPGEEVVVVLPPKESSEQKPEKEKSFWERLLEKLNLRD